MLVESFECTETAAEPIEAAEEAVALIEQLGLKGQQKLLRKNENTNRDERNPYRMIRKDELFVYGTICPKLVLLEDYEAGPVPLRILQIAAHAREFFKFLKVGYQADCVEKDPVLLGSDNNYLWSDNAWEHGTKDFILARWGDELESFPVLLNRACTAARKALGQSARTVAALVEAASDAELIEHGPGSQVAWSR